ncbi:MAG TPA: MotA/TolQ/ExbB proton channel family protein [Isosphaeraceae bacterium]|nr:MotA/TolQ/ExbB proton channel family protein [Isosphaeraceae bacterium]
MRRRKLSGRTIMGFSIRVILGLAVVSSAGSAGGWDSMDRDDSVIGSGVRGGAIGEGRGGSPARADFAERVLARARQLGEWLISWYGRTPPPERATWGGLAACAGLGLVVFLERMARLRQRRIMPAEFTQRFVDRLHEGKFDCGQALDYCEQHPSPAARVALAAVRRWGRPAADLERAVTMAHRVETERLRRNVGTLRRVAVLAPLLGVLGTLLALGRALEAMPPVVVPGPALAWPAQPSAPPVAVAWGPALAAALMPLSTGIVIATIALVAYDGVLARVETLAGALDRLGAETIEAIATTAPISPRPIPLTPRP